MKKRLVLFVLLYIFWIIFSWSYNVMHLVIGFFYSFIITIIISSLFNKEKELNFTNMLNCLWLFLSIPILAWHIVLAGIDIILRLFKPRITVKSEIIKFKTELKSETGIVWLANTISLLPGMIAIDVDLEKSYIYILVFKNTSEEIYIQKYIDVYENIYIKVFG